MISINIISNFIFFYVLEPVRKTKWNNYAIKIILHK